MMKRLIVGGLTVLLLAAVTAPVVNAQQTALNTTTLNIKRNQPTPFDLVSLAYQGNFKPQGIPGSGALLAAYQIGRVDAEELVKSAVAANVLSPSILTNRGYLNAVDIQLSNLGKDR